jgi:hypothetical protein
VIDRDTTLEAHCDAAAVLPARLAALLVASAAAALDPVHRRGEIHGHLGPWSLVRSGDREARFVDLGHAADRLAGRPLGSLAPSEASYLSPEQVRGAALDPRSDVFSLGAVLHHLLAGTRPFPGDATASILYRIVHEPASELPARVPAALRAVVDRALAKRPEDRFASAAELASAIRSAAEADAPLREAHAGQEPLLPHRSLPPPPLPAALARPRSRRPLVWGAVALGLVAAAVVLLFGDRMFGAGGGSREVWWEARVRVEPAQAKLLLDGIPLELGATGVVRFRNQAPYPLLSAVHGCRTVDRRLGPEDADGEIALAVEPLTLARSIDAGVAGAEVWVDGRSAGSSPVELDLDLCREHRVELRATGHKASSVVIPVGATPAEAERLLDGLSLEVVPRGRLRLPDTKIELTWWLDGERLDPKIEVWELEEGSYELRFRNGFHFLEGKTEVRIAGGGTTVPEPELPSMSTLVVQAFPPNCRAWVRKAGGEWSSLGETPAERSVAVGRYEVKVEFKPTGETRIERVEVRRGKTPPVRVAFGTPR